LARRTHSCMSRATVLEVAGDVRAPEGVVADSGCIATHYGVQLGMGMAVRCAT
jgi:hypothetical protein